MYSVTSVTWNALRNDIINYKSPLRVILNEVGFKRKKKKSNTIIEKFSRPWKLRVCPSSKMANGWNNKKMETD